MGIKIKGSTILEPMLAVGILSFGLTIGAVSITQIFDRSYQSLETIANNTIPEIQKQEEEVLFKKGKVYTYDLFELEVTYERTEYDGVSRQVITGVTKSGTELFKKQYLIRE